MDVDDPVSRHQRIADVLPLDLAVSTAVLRGNVHKVAQRMEGELGEERFLFITPGDNEDPSLPDPGPPLTVGLDGGYVHSCERPNRQEGWFEVIVGKSITAEGDAKGVALSTSETANRNAASLNS